MAGMAKQIGKATLTIGGQDFECYDAKIVEGGLPPKFCAAPVECLELPPVEFTFAGTLSSGLILLMLLGQLDFREHPVHWGK